uniref:Putative secreted protein n=1 Tax=Anopheles darlingi TaxID=43151 RepID=A0A2M4DPM3_ANODA
MFDLLPFFRFVCFLLFCIGGDYHMFGNDSLLFSTVHVTTLRDVYACDMDCGKLAISKPGVGRVKNDNRN